MANAQLGVDLKLNEDNDLVFGSNDDFVTVSGNNNLSQAIINRLRTGIGELRLHSLYGSRTKILLGEKNINSALALVRQATREALNQEPRISQINSIIAQFKDNSTINLSVTVTPIGEETTLNIVYPFFL